MSRDSLTDDADINQLEQQPGNYLESTRLEKSSHSDLKTAKTEKDEEIGRNIELLGKTATCHIDKEQKANNGTDQNQSILKALIKPSPKKYIPPHRRSSNTVTCDNFSSSIVLPPLRPSELSGASQPNWRTSYPTRSYNLPETSKSSRASFQRRSENPVQMHHEKFNARQSKGNQVFGEREKSDDLKTTTFELKPITYTAVDGMLRDDIMDVSHIALRLSIESSGFDLRLKISMDTGWTKLILQVMKKLCSANKPSLYLNQVLLTLLNNDFELRAMKVLKETFTHRALVDAEDAATQVSNCLHLMRGWLMYTQNTAEQAVRMLLPYIKSMVDNHTLGDYQNIQERLQEIEDLLFKCYSQLQPGEGSASKGGHLADEHEKDAPDDFRQLSIVPTIDDIRAEESPFVRISLIDSAYRNTDHYLDVQFRLLREDFIRPLREGITEFINPDIRGMAFENLRKAHQGMKVYENVTITYPKLSKSGIHYCVHFNINRLRHVQWEDSKRLLFGNLVCLSSDGFKSHVLFATITGRDIPQIQTGYIQVEFLNLQEDGENTSLISLQDMKKAYCMVESEAYFEAYRHVLAGLKETQEIPLDQYIVECQTDLHPPAYLQVYGRNATYDFYSILEDKENEARKGFCVLDTDSWPTAEELNLNPSQVQALQSALTNELSIIQGPPGTGKTHVGLMIMKMLLGNKLTSPRMFNASLLRNDNEDKAFVPRGPIFVVCFTNHALDQFLEGIAKFHPKGLVRVGGRCKTESLKKYMLSTIRHDNDLTKNLRKIAWEVLCQLDYQASVMEESEEALKESTRSILSLECLQQVILPRHKQQLKTFGKYDDSLLNWLGVRKRTYLLPEDFYVVEETIDILVRSIRLPARFSKNDFVVAVNATGCLDEKLILEWLHAHQIHSYPETVNADIVFAFLDRLRISFCPSVMVEKGFHPFEVKCAWLAFSKFYAKDNVREATVCRWLMSKRESLKSQNDSPQVIHGIKQQSDYVKDQRMIDMENDDKLQFIRPDETLQKRSLLHRSKRNVVAAKHDKLAVVEEIDVSDDGFQISSHERKRRKKALIKQMKSELSKFDTMSDEEVNRISEIIHLTTEEKWKLYRYWVNALRSKLRKNLSKHAADYNRLAKLLSKIRNQQNYTVLMQADVVAITTTGAAKYRDIIQKLPAKVVIVEEAAEVLESHIITSMPKSTQHLILIGDHQQLKPSPTVYELARKFNLDTSLFERLVKNGIPCSRLTLQHRMRPRIADLIRPHIYKELNDHESVLNYGEVSGIEKSVFFISHDHEEDNVRDNATKANQYEANFIVGLCKYLLQQGYSPDQITILSAYVGQLLVFKKILERKLNNKKLKVTAVDNFQGEENDIILLSLVRSNAEDKIGFLSIENRVCVALSRAKKGLYCIGNFEMLKRKSELWRKILKGLKEDEMVGKALTLICKIHPDKKLQVVDEKDFQKFPEGGCGQQCRFRLDCGHVCTRFCHPDDQEHKTFTCIKPCEKLCPAGHIIETQCFRNPLCRKRVEKVLPKCEHTQEVFCYERPEFVICQTPREKTMSCGHSYTDLCGNPDKRSCEIEVEVQTECGHVRKISCADSQRATIKNCQQKCNEVLKCGHLCNGTCGLCYQGRLHAGCSNPKCGRVLCCGHICKENCSSVCPPCMEKCETSCQHSSCERPCYMPCMLCKEECTWECEHYKCNKLCSEPCDRPKCDEPCLKELLCGHPCIGLCGEPCPEVCRVCDKEEVTEILFGDEDEENARFVQLQCGHIFTYENLDKWMEQKTMNEGSEIDIKLKECPRCKTLIRRSTRYGEIVNKQLMLINEVRMKISGEPSEVQRCQGKLSLALEMDDRVVKHFPSRAFQLKNKMKLAQSLPALSAIEVKFTCLEEFSSIKELRTNSLSRDLNCAMDDIVEWLFWKRSYFSEQEKEDLHRERQRCKDCSKLEQLEVIVETLGENVDSGVKSHLAEVRNLLYCDLDSFIKDKQEEVEILFNKIDALVPDVVPGLGITDNERKMILGAMNLSKGHWYSCQNGHVYCIGECGGAMEEAKCPYCKETIGGTQHRLAEGNRVAGIMDGATQSAWDPNTFHIPEEVLLWRDGN